MMAWSGWARGGRVLGGCFTVQRLNNGGLVWGVEKVCWPGKRVSSGFELFHFPCWAIAWDGQSGAGDGTPDERRGLPRWSWRPPGGAPAQWCMWHVLVVAGAEGEFGGPSPEPQELRQPGGGGQKAQSQQMRRRTPGEAMRGETFNSANEAWRARPNARERPVGFVNGKGFGDWGKCVSSDVQCKSASGIFWVLCMTRGLMFKK